MDIGLIVTMVGVVVAGLAGILGVWMERDPGGTKIFALFFSALIIGATGVEGVHAVAAQKEATDADAKMAFLLEQLSELAAKGDNPALSAFVGTELAIAARANPDVVKKMEDNIAQKGGDPTKVMETAKRGRRQAAGLSPEPPKAGEKPQLAPVFAAQQSGSLSSMSSGLVGDDLADQLPDELPADLDDAKEQAADLVAGAQQQATQAATKAVDDAKEQATQAVDNAKEDAEQAAKEAEEAARKEAEQKQKEAEQKAKEAEEKARKEAEQKAKEAEEKAKNKAKNKAKDANKAKDLLNK